MNSKLLISLIILFVFLNITLFTLSKNLSKSQQSSPTANQSFPIRSADTIDLPISEKHQGVHSVTLNYNFTGKIAKIQSAGKNTRLILDISDSQTPDFLIKKDASVYLGEEKTLTSVPASSLKVGTEINIGMSYNISKKIWSLVGVSTFSSK